MEENSNSSTLLHVLTQHVSHFEADGADMNEKHEKLEEKLIDLKWRSMTENLIFTGIKDPGDPKEDTETNLHIF